VLTNRAVIVADSTPITITPADESPDMLLTLDGRVVQRIERGDTIRITRAPQRLPLAMLPGVSFFDVLRQKLKWSGAAV
jgi:NAD+ kinase